MPFLRGWKHQLELTERFESPPPGAEPRPAPPGFTPPLPHSQRVSSCSGDPESTTGTDPHPKPSESRPPQPGFTQSRVHT